MKLGYARVSMMSQNIEYQIAELQKDGCEKIFTDKASGKTTDREGLKELLAVIKPGDVLVVWKLDRLGRSLQDLIKIIDMLDKNQIGFRSTTEGFDTTTSGGRLLFHIFGALAEFERNVISERTLAGLAYAKRIGRVGGRRKRFTNQQMIEIYRKQANREITIYEAVKELKMSRTTYYRYLKLAQPFL